MADVARDVERGVPVDPMNPIIPSQYVEALDSVGLAPLERTLHSHQFTPQVRLAETFLGIADSLTRPRGALMYA